ncbi:MAG: BON domain-containing protein [Verrucomicrobiota bacterium]|jgi:osmotically-inducible protein OsmY|nr:BON domain-containing protein [Verrucomicrobiota bacterium]MDI9385694.1 BON domain-containing protein [Verrucomicrobiota bacterium]HCF94023.1 hypothetical protein [Verrucomicrobiota bacterium]
MNWAIRYWTVVAVVLIAVQPFLGSGCQKMRGQQPTELQQEAAAIQSITPVRSDEEITSEIRRVFSRDPELAAELIDYTVTDGVVVLDGRVSDFKLSTKAVSLAREVIGVHRVVNRLTSM